MKSWTQYTVTLLTMMTLSARMAHAELDVEVGVDGAGRLAFPPFDFGTVILEPVDPGNPLGLQGYAGDDPGWAAEGAPEGLGALADGSNIAVEILSLSPALRMFDPDAGLAELLPGSQWVVGGPEFDAHPLWLIDTADPAFDPDQSVWLGTFRLIDLGTTGYLPSEQMTFAFGIPEPATIGLALPLFAALSRRRRVL